MAEKKISGPVRLFHRARDLYRRITDSSYRNFRKYEYPTLNHQDINSLAKLKKIRSLDIAKFGSVSPSLKEHIANQKRENKLIDKGRNILPYGSIKVMDGNKQLHEIRLGLDLRTNKLYYSNSKANNIPIWNKHSDRTIIKYTENLYPKSTGKLHLKTRVFNDDIAFMPNEVKEQLHSKLLESQNAVFKSNAIFDKSVQNISAQDFTLKKYNTDLPVQVPGLKNNPYYIQSASDNYVILQPQTALDNNKNKVMMPFSEFRNKLQANKVEPLGESKKGVSIGIAAGKLYVKVGDKMAVDGSLKKWTNFDDFMKDNKAPEALKHEVQHTMINNKDFLDERSSKQIQSPSGASYTLKKHYGSGAYYIAANRNGKQGTFKSLDKIEKEYPALYKHVVNTQLKQNQAPKQSNNLKIKQ